MKLVLVEAGIVYVGAVIVLLALENWMLFRPLRASEDWVDPSTFHLTIEDVELEMGDGTRIHGWWCPLEETGQVAGALLYCHGNAGNLSHRAYAIPSWKKYLRMPLFIFDYPGYGRSEGKPNEAKCYAAAEAAYNWLIQIKGISPGRIIIYGGSLGGGVAVDLASRKTHRALILVKTFTSAPDVGQKMFPWLPVRWVMRNRFDNLEKIGKCNCPVFIAHGTTDSMIPFSLGERLFQAANEPKRFFALEGIDHNDPLPPELFISLRQFLEEEAPPFPE